MPQLPLVTFKNLCRNCKHVVSHFVLKVGVTERLVSQLDVVILLRLGGGEDSSFRSKPIFNFFGDKVREGLTLVGVFLEETSITH
jgi:hypothetical protein